MARGYGNTVGGLMDNNVFGQLTVAELLLYLAAVSLSIVMMRKRVMWPLVIIVALIAGGVAL